MTERRKPPTRYRVEVVDADGEVHWDLLVHEVPTQRLRRTLSSGGFTFRRLAEGSTEASSLVYSVLDPVNSILAAQEFHARRETKVSAVLMLLLEAMPEWVSREEVRKVGGDDGPRRVRELRQRGWPVEIRQLDKRHAWHCRMADSGLLRAWNNLLGPQGSFW